MELDRRRFLVLPASLIVLAAIYWWWSGYEPAGTVMLVVFTIALTVLGLILIPTAGNVGHAAPIVDIPESEPVPGDEVPEGEMPGDTSPSPSPTPSASNAAEVELRIQRFNPETDDEPHWEHYIVNA